MHGSGATVSSTPPEQAPPPHVLRATDNSSGIEDFDAAHNAACLEMKRNFSISPGASWGTMDVDHQV
jgi:hypothetical protein